MAAPWLTSVDPAYDDDGQRACAQGQFCATATRVPGPGGDTWVPARGPRAFCAADRGKVAAALAELPRLYVSLSGELSRPAQPETATRSPFGPRLPLRADVQAIMALFAEVLVSWHVRVADVARLTPPPERDEQHRATARDGWYVDRAVLVITPRLDALLALGPEPSRRAVSHAALADLAGVDGIVRSVYAAVTPDLSGAEAGLEILALRRLARSVLGETRQRPVELLGVPCQNPDCDMLALRRAELPSDPAEPEWWSECRACGDRMTYDDYRDWTRRYARWAESAEHAGEAS